MKSSLLKSAAFSFLLCVVFFQNINGLHAQSDPLPSWSDGSVKNAILEFVKDTTQQESLNFVPLQERVATFDQDGTLWVEQPFYAQIFFVIDSIKALAPQHPEWKEKEPFKSILAGNLDIIKTLKIGDVEQLVAETHFGITIDEYQQRVRNWLAKAVHPRFNKPFTELIYQPMLEVIQLLKNHGFKIYIVSGGGQEFIRAYAEQIYGIGPEHVIGSAGKVKYEYQNGQPVLMKRAEMLFVDDKGGKPEGINLIIGRRPYAAFGNSVGDREMLEWTQAGKGKRLELLVHHDDAEREYAYGSESKIGTFSEALLEEAKQKNWIVVSMKNDWKTIFP